MKRFILLLLSLLLICANVLAADFSKLIIMHTNDTHGYHKEENGKIGLSKIAAYRDEFKSKGYEVLLLDAGDTISGGSILAGYSKGEAAINFFNTMEIDAMTLGNHEFDYGSARIQELVGMSKFPIVCANVVVDATSKLFLPPSTVIQKGDIKIGVFGLLTPSTATSSDPINTKGLTILNGDRLYQCAQKEVNALRAKGCDLIVCLGHLGSKPKDAGSRSEDILSKVQGIDILIDAHDHLIKNDNIGNGLRVEAGSFTEHIGVISYKDGRWKEDLLSYGVLQNENKQVVALVNKVAGDVNLKMNKTLANASFDLLNFTSEPRTNVRTKEMPLGNLAADAILWQARQALVLDKIELDAAIINGGGLRASIKKGKVTEGMLRSVLPFNNQIFVLTIPGAKLLEVFEASTADINSNGGAFPQVAGIEYEVNNQIPYSKGPIYPGTTIHSPAKPGERVTIKSVGNKAFKLDENYKIALMSFLAHGGSSYCAMVPYAEASGRTIGYTDSEAMINFLNTELHGIISESYQNYQGRILVK